MRKYLGVLAAIALCSCSNDWSAGLADKRGGSPTGSSPSMSMEEARATVAAQRSGGPSFANAPDNGSLVQYPQGQVIRRTGAYTWHAADLSEDHALRSTITGNLSFTAPDGTPIQLAYERHVEHPDGNWSWFGRAAGERGESTVITFGEEAVFGSIPQGRDQPPLRLTIADGRAWVVSADARLLREIRNEATHPASQDFLVPPKLAASTAAATSTASGGIEAMGAEAVATTANGKTVVDVLVGFTDGYSAYRTGASAAITRIYNLVEVTNQAYRNSQVNAEVRLVHTMQVSYPDATANKTALEELTGFKAPSTKTTPAPAFSALRSARDQYGADLVVLLRRFQDPENGGCGIAWLIGGGRSGIDASDEFFGYSVVSDGQDAGTDGKTYFCRDETLAHELGHNMGSQHDADNAKKDDGAVSYGAYSYSFGYRTAAGAGNFHTVMAYGDSGQTRNRVFSNPDVSICGIDGNIVCGVPDQADNSRSLSNTIPITAKFRNQIVPFKTQDDINGDGKSDIVWMQLTQNKIAYWIMNGSAVSNYGFGTGESGYKIIGTGDFNGDNRNDLLWDNGGTLYLWTSNGAEFSSTLVGSYGNGWKPSVVSDVNGDGRVDIVWLQPEQNKMAYWLMNGSNVIGSGLQEALLGYTIIGAGDFNGDSRFDLLWDNGGTLYLWTSTASGFDSTPVASYGDGWKPEAVADVNGDGKTDIIWRQLSKNQIAYWMMNGASVTGYGFQTGLAGYSIIGTGDFNGDSRFDLLWDNGGTLYTWLSTGYGFNAALVASYGDGWVPWSNALKR